MEREIHEGDLGEGIPENLKGKDWGRHKENTIIAELKCVSKFTGVEWDPVGWSPT